MVTSMRGRKIEGGTIEGGTNCFDRNDQRGGTIDFYIEGAAEKNAPPSRSEDD